MGSTGPRAQMSIQFSDLNGQESLLGVRNLDITVYRLPAVLLYQLDKGVQRGNNHSTAVHQGCEKLGRAFAWMESIIEIIKLVFYNQVVIFHSEGIFTPEGVVI